MTTPTISPTSKELDYNEAAIFTASATTTPAYTTFTFNENTYYYYNNTMSTSAPTATSEGVTYSWTLTGAANSYLTPTSGTGTTITITHSTQATDDATSTLSVTATANSLSATSTSNATITAVAPKTDPTGISITSDSPMTVYVGQTGTITYSLTPSPCYNNVAFTSTDTGVATVAAGGVVTGVAVGSTTVTASAKKIDGTVAASATVTVNVRNKVATPVISFTPVGDGTTATAAISCATLGVTIYYTTDGSDPTSSSTEYSSSFSVNDGNEVRAIAIKTTDGTFWDNSVIASATYVSCTTADPVITYTASGSTATVTITGEAGATIYYTTNGNDPSSSSSSGTSPVTISGVSSGTVIKAYAKNGTCQASGVASKTIITSGVSGGIVTLYDYEDHTWSYYQASANLPAGYPTDYLSSPDPRNVKITYKGGSVSGASEVAISALDGEGQNEMVYYKTLEKSVPGLTGDYPYTVISNPFSKRPRTTGSTGTNGFYGFAGWKVVNGGEYISDYNDNDVIPLDATIHFTGLDTGYTLNCTSAEVVFEATWTEATVKTGNSAQSFTGGTYETNFWVLTENPSNAVTVPGNCTMTARYPDGTVSWNGNFNSAITAGGNNAKVEFVNMNSTNNVTASNYTFTMGRGIVNSANGGQLSGGSRDANCNQTVKIESGTYATLYNFTNGLNSNRTCDQLMILGCDYDRAKSDNTKLTVRGSMYVGSSIQLNRSANSLYTRTYIKSGNFGSTVSVAGNTSYTGAGGTNTYYYSVANTHNAGRRYLCVEGGRIMGIAGGMDETNSQTVTARAFDLRVRGTAQVDGVVYGAAEYANARGTRTMVFTGGTIGGWIAGGANGTQTTNGALTGATYLYVGGETTVDSEGSNQVLNRAVGGNVFGAGCGYSASSNSGQILTYNTNVVVADDSYIERGVYGGGSYGYTTNTSNIFVLGGTVDGKNGGVSGTTYSSTITGGVFGGACQNQGGTVNITMTGGQVNGGIYGGSNATGNISDNVTMHINGGQVGTSSQTANIHGGGYGSATRVLGSVNLTLGEENQTGDGVTVYGDVYGGSALGITNGNTARTSGAVTNVTMNAGTVNGSVYGGGLGATGTQADVWGTVAVVVNGGSVKTVDGVDGSGAVYGCNNVYGRPRQADVTVTVNGTDAAAAGEYAIDNVFGGGNAAAYTGNPVVTITGTKTNCAVGNVYGGGLGSTAIVTGNATVNMQGGRARNLFGGGSQANLTGSVEMTVSGGMVDDDVYGGGALANTQTAGGTTTVNLTGGTVGNAYGGGLGSETTAAVVSGNVTVNVNGTAFTNAVSDGITTKGRVFGCNNINGTPKGTVTVHVYKTVGVNGAPKPEKDTDTYELQAVYGGGNLAAYDPTDADGKKATVIVDGCGESSIAYVYGGGNAAPVPATDVTIKGSYEIGQVFGGGNGKDRVNGAENPGADVGLIDRGSGKESYGAGTAETKILGGTIHSVFGGSNTKGDVVTSATVTLGNQNLETCEFIVGEVYGAGNEAYMSGSSQIDMNCIEGLAEIYGGSRNADVDKDIELNIKSGYFGKVFGGNNIGGKIKGSITVNIEESGCLPVEIDELYLGGNNAPYSVYGYDTNGNIKTSGTKVYADPVLNIISATRIGNTYGGGLGEGATLYGDPTVNINMKQGSIDGNYVYVAGKSDERYKDIDLDEKRTLDLGELGTVFGGGNAAKVVGNTKVQIGTGKAADGTTPLDRQDAKITGNIYGGGNKAEVTGSADVVVGK